jgi:aspartyl protease
VLVFPDSQPPWSEEAPGKRGTVALPVVLALEGIRWTRDGKCQTGPSVSRARSADANLAFDGGSPLTRVQMSGHHLDFVLDTGNQSGTQLWERFARDFPEVANTGRKATKRLHQIGGSTEQEIVAIPEIILRVGGYDRVLRPANIFSKPVGNDLQHGLLGMDVLSQASEVVLDFRAMSLSAR